MLKAISTHIFLRSRLHPGLLDTLARTGADGIELFAARPHFDYTDTVAVREIANWFRANSVKPLSLHAPIYMEDTGRGNEPVVNVLHSDKGRRIEAMDEVRRALEIADQIPVQYMVLHMGDRGDTWDTRTLENALTAVEHLQAYARPMGVTLLLENIQNGITTPTRLLEILNVGHFDAVGVCLDFGHAHLGDGVPTTLGELRNVIRTAHIHDNAGDRDAHLWPGDGTIAWDEPLRDFAAAPLRPAGVLEIHYGLGSEPNDIVEPAKAAFARMDRAAATL